MVLLVAALLLLLPLMLSVALEVLGRFARTIVGAVPHVARMELSAAGARAVAITATGAIAVFGSVAIQGAHKDLLAGLEDAARAANSSADLWVAPAGAYDLMNTAPFTPIEQAKLKRLPDVRAVRAYRGGLLDYGERRLLVLAPPRRAAPLLPASQILVGSARQATDRVREGGWLVLSKAIAAEHHLHVGQSLRLPTPNPMSFRIASLSTNLGWSSGAIVMSSSDYARAWASPDVSAYAILLAHERRPRLAKLKLEGFPRASLWHTILLESALLVGVGVGCATGAIFGLYGQQLADRALAETINFPVVYSVAGVGALSSLALMTAAVLAVLAIPGYLAASVPAGLALAD